MCLHKIVNPSYHVISNENSEVIFSENNVTYLVSVTKDNFFFPTISENRRILYPAINTSSYDLVSREIPTFIPVVRVPVIFQKGDKI